MNMKLVIPMVLLVILLILVSGCIQTKKISECEQAQFPTDCYTNVAIKEAISSGDPTPCDRGLMEYEGKFNEGRCFSEFAVEYPDSSLCERVTVHKDLCFEAVAEATRNPDLCYKIEEFRKQVEVAGVELTTTVEECLKRVAYESSIVRSGVEACDKLTEYEEKEMCYYSINIAENCDKKHESDESARRTCYLTMSFAMDLCEKTDKRAYCLQTVALRTNNYTLCNFLEKEMHDECFYKIALDTNNAELCKKVSYYESRENCLENFK